MARGKKTTKNSSDGSFLIEYRDGWAFLTVHPPGKGGRPVYREDVLARMKILGVSTVCADEVASAVSQAGGVPFPPIEWPQGVELSASVEIQVTEDHLSASVILRPPKKGGSTPGATEMERKLAEAGVTSGLLPDAIGEISANPEFDTSIVVALGSKPKNGLPRRLEYTFDPDPGRPYIFGKDGSVNLKELKFVQDKKSGDTLARVLPAEESVNGRSVFGEVIPALEAEQEIGIAAGENVQYSEAEQIFTALIDGNVFIDKSKICIEPVVRVPQVNYETGNIHFDGSVVVVGGIADGFTVEAGGSVEVEECVGRASIICGRDVLLKGGMNGDSEGNVRSGGNITSKYIENARISCRGNLFVAELLMHTDFVVGENLVLKGKRGELLGGSGIAGKNLWCKQLGSHAEIPTKISLGIEPAILSGYIKLKLHIEHMIGELEGVKAEIRGLERRLRESNGADQKLRAVLASHRNRAETLTSELRQGRVDLQRRKNGLSPANGTLAVIEDLMYPKSVIAFGETEYRPGDKPARQTVLKIVGGKISEGGYNPAEPPKFDLSTP